MKTLARPATALGEKSKAEEAYNKALALDPKIFPAQLNLAVLLTGLDRQKDALPHLAAAVGTPVVAIFGPTDPAVWAPRCERASVVSGTLEQIGVDQVMQAVAGRVPNPGTIF